MAEPIALTGRGRMLAPPGEEGPAQVTLGGTGFTLALGRESRVAAYRDLDVIAIQGGTALLVLGSGAGQERVLLDRFGSALGQLVRELRDRRLRQRAVDALMTLDADEPIGLVEYEDGSEHGVGQLAYHAWGALLAPLDERLPWIPMRRSSIEDVRTVADEGLVEVVLAAGEDGSAPAVVRLLGLGAAARTRGDRLAGLRAAARDDAARIIDALVPDAPYAARQEAARTLIDGHPARSADLPLSWSSIETGVLVDPPFAAAYQMLCTKAGPLADERAIAIAPIQPGGDTARSWFLVPLPANLVALELVSAGAHATYAFRVQPRIDGSGGATDPRRALRDTMRAISEALVDSRFLREPMALPDEALRLPRHLRYRLALAALPSLAAARARFVARIVHRDDASWAAALDDLIAWHALARDDAATWPGRAMQEALIDDADASDDDDSETGASGEATATLGAT